MPINRASGLHAWGNIVPACKTCNDIKRHLPWADHPQLDDTRRAVIAQYIADYNYDPDVTELRTVLERPYNLADSQTRALVDFGLVASPPTSPAYMHDRRIIARRIRLQSIRSAPQTRRQTPSMYT